MGCNKCGKKKRRLTEGEGISTSTQPRQQAGSYISAGAFKAGGILTTDGRKSDRGKLPAEVDITGGEVGTYSPAVAQPPRRTPKPNGHGDPKSTPVGRYGDGEEDDGPRKKRYDHPTEELPGNSTPCCEKCDNGKWRRCQGGGKKSGPCTYATISDCQLANMKGQSNIKTLSLADVYESKEDQQKLLNEITRINELNILL